MKTTWQWFNALIFCWMCVWKLSVGCAALPNPTQCRTEHTFFGTRACDTTRAKAIVDTMRDALPPRPPMTKNDGPAIRFATTVARSCLHAPPNTKSRDYNQIIINTRIKHILCYWLFFAVHAVNTTHEQYMLCNVHSPSSSSITHFASGKYRITAQW